MFKDVLKKHKIESKEKKNKKESSKKDKRQNEENPKEDEKVEEKEQIPEIVKEPSKEMQVEKEEPQEIIKESAEEFSSPFDPTIEEPVEMEELSEEVITQAKKKVPLGVNLKKLQKGAGLKTPEELASIDSDQLRTLIEIKDIPEEIKGKDDDDKKEKYLKLVMNSIERTYPTKTFRKRLAEDNIQEKVKWENLKNFIIKNPKIDPTNPTYEKLDWEGIAPEREGEIKESLKNLAREIKEYPEFDFKSLLERKDFKNRVRKDVLKFLSDASDFSLQNTNIERYLIEKGESAFTRIPDKKRQENVKKQLKRFQRLSRLTPKYEEVESLAGEGLHSASSIARIPESTFIKKFETVLNGEENAKKIHSKATQSTVNSMALLTKFAPLFNSINPRVLPSKEKLYRSYGKYPRPDTDGGISIMPNLETLFEGYLDLCDCGHCSSVYSPSAYFVDLMQFLAGSLPNDIGMTPLEILFNRRPDLQYIELSCENTNKTIPYIDLVNEILEQYISEVILQLEREPSSIKSKGSSEELIAEPENLNTAVYDALSKLDNVYPFNMPFNLWVEEARIYLEHLESSRYEILETYNICKKEPISEGDLACEHLKITQEEKNIIVDTDSNEVWEKTSQYYGYKDEDQFQNYDYNDLTNFKKSIFFVPEFLRRTRLTYSELTRLLNTKFVNPEGSQDKASLNLIDKNESQCDIDNMVLSNNAETLTPLPVQTLNKIHRFLRLWRKVDWSMEEIDTIMNCLGFSDIDEYCLITLSYIKMIQEELDISLTTLLSFWLELSPISAENEVSLIAGLHISNSELKTLMNYELVRFLVRSIFRQVLERDPEPIEMIIRVSKLNKGKISLKEMIRELALTKEHQDHFIVPSSEDKAITYCFNHLLGRDPSPDEIEKWVDVSFDEGIDNVINGLIDSDEYEEKFGEDGMAFDINYEDPTMNPEIILALHRHTLLCRGLKLSIDDYLSLRALLYWIDPFDSEEIKNTLIFNEKVRKVMDSKFTVKELDYLIMNQFVISEGICPQEENITLMLTELRDGLKKIADESGFNGEQYKVQSGNYLKQKLSNFLNIEPMIMDFLVSRILPCQAAYSLNESFINSEQNEMEINIDNFSQQFSLFYLLHKISMLLKKFEISSKELEHLTEYSENFESFDLNAFKSDTFSAEFSFKQWERFYDVFNLRDNLKYGDVDLINLFITATNAEEIKELKALSEDQMDRLLMYLPMEVRENLVFIELTKEEKLGIIIQNKEQLSKIISKKFKEVLIALTHWDIEDLDFLEIQTKDFTNEILLNRIKRCFDLSNKLGISVSKANDWASISVEAAQAEEIRKTVKAKYEEESWIDVAGPLKNKLREKQKNALITYLLHYEKLGNSNDLFELFLLDVETTSCKLTSRIVQAISTLQLFIQRCLMNLEQKVDPQLGEIGVSSDAIDGTRWKWMKNYRIWEANRKIFLYPENYIRFELLDNKSPFFQDLENELLQTEITDNSVKKAFLNYLEKLDDIARLEVCGECVDESKNIIYIFGKTVENPHIYYYRIFKILETETEGNNLTYIKRGYWTPWQKLDVDIEGKHLLPIIYNDRLYIFWPIFTKSTEKPTSASKDKLEYPDEKWEIKLAWSEYRNNKWSAKKISTDSTELTIKDSLYEEEKYTLSAWIKNNELIIGIYCPEVDFSMVKLRQFMLKSCQGKLSLAKSIDSYGERLSLPIDTNLENMSLTAEPGTGLGLHLFTGIQWTGDLFQKSIFTSLLKPNPSLGNWNLLYSHQYQYNNNILSYPQQTETIYEVPFFFQDDKRTFFVIPKINNVGNQIQEFKFQFSAFYHSYVCAFIEQLNKSGIRGLLECNMNLSSRYISTEYIITSGDILTDIRPQMELCHQHIWSPDGTKLAYLKSPQGLQYNCELWVAQRSGANLINHVLISSQVEFNGLLDWYDDWLLIRIRREQGKPSSYYGRNELWKIREDGTEMTQVTFTQTNKIRTYFDNHAYDNRGTAVWGKFIPGTNLVYFHAHQGNGHYETYVCNTDGTDNWYKISHPNLTWRPALSPTGNKLLWGHQTDFRYPTTHKSCNVDGTGKTTIKKFNKRISVTVLADGNTVVWSDNGNIYAINLDGTNERTVIDDAYINTWLNYHPTDSEALLIGSNRSDGN
ncbi:MAG: neuraminidase-like domain-containing protein, partial [Candidatus Hermodarchaeota archaeon]